MLTLSRKIEESIMVGNDIEIKILGIQGDNVKIGISAPRKTPIHRKEVYDQILEVNRQATQLDVDKIKNIMKKD